MKNYYKIVEEGGRIFAVDEKDRPCVYEENPNETIYFDDMKEAEEVVKGWNEEEAEFEKRKAEEKVAADTIFPTHINEWYKDKWGTIRWKVEEDLNKEYTYSRSQESFFSRITFFTGLPMVFTTVFGFPPAIIMIGAGLLFAYGLPAMGERMNPSDISTAKIIFKLGIAWLGGAGVLAVFPFLNKQKGGELKFKRLGTKQEDGTMTYTQAEVDAIVEKALAEYESDAALNLKILAEQKEGLEARVNELLGFEKENQEMMAGFLTLAKEIPEVGERTGIDLDKCTPEQVSKITGLTTKEAYDKFFKKAK